MGICHETLTIPAEPRRHAPPPLDGLWAKCFQGHDRRMNEMCVVCILMFGMAFFLPMEN